MGGTYYIIRDSNSVIRLAATYEDAMADPPVAIDITSTGDCAKNIFGKAGSTAFYFDASGAGYPYDNMRFYGPTIEGCQLGMYLGGYDQGGQMLLMHPRFEQVANYIEAAPNNLEWFQAATPLSPHEMTIFCPRLYGTTGDHAYMSTVVIQGAGYYGLSGYQSYSAAKDILGSQYSPGGNFTFFNPAALDQTTNLKNIIKGRYTFRVDEMIPMAYGGGDIQTSYYPMNKGFEGTSGPNTGNVMTYAKNSVVWDTDVTAGKPMGWVCSKSGSILPTGSGITAAGNVSGTTLTLTSTTNSHPAYLFPGCFITIDLGLGDGPVQNQIKSITSFDTATNLGVFELYTAIAGGPYTGVAVADSRPTWVPMMNYVAAPDYPGNSGHNRRAG